MRAHGSHVRRANGKCTVAAQPTNESGRRTCSRRRMTVMQALKPASMSSSVNRKYAALAASGEIERDPAQEALLAKLARLEARLAEHRLAKKSSSLGWLFGARERSAPIKGLYIFGEVGRGKTM